MINKYSIPFINVERIYETPFESWGNTWVALEDLKPAPKEEKTDDKR